MLRDMSYIHLTILPLEGIVIVVYIHIGVRSALLVSIDWAMREPLSVRRVTGTGSHAFYFNIIAEFGGLIGK